ncbi:MAG: hypothetical protein Q8N55_00645 [bacterium]|nr:hypothetical protein [bacterium]
MTILQKIIFKELEKGSFFFFKGFVWKKVDNNFAAMPACFQTARDDVITKRVFEDDESVFISANT